MGELAAEMMRREEARMTTKYLRGAIIGNGLSEDNIFDLESPRNRDNSLVPFVRLRERLRQLGCDLSTSDCLSPGERDFEIHIDVQHPGYSAPTYLLMLEASQIWPRNGSMAELARYKRIFTWRDDLVDGERFIKTNHPNVLVAPPVDGFRDRDRFACIIAGNKITTVPDPHELYSARIEVARWYERYAPDLFDLYGSGWDMPPPSRRRSLRVIQRLSARIFPRSPFPSYRGRIDSKASALRRTRYCYCYENLVDLPGYITEKIFDCFLSGCIPVYLGAANITDHIPASCFIDRRSYGSTADVHGYLSHLSEDDFVAYQRNIADFLMSHRSYPFGADAFAENIGSRIVRDLRT